MQKSNQLVSGMFFYTFELRLAMYIFFPLEMDRFGGADVEMGQCQANQN